MKSRKCCYSPILSRVAVTLVALAWSSLAFCGEIQDAAMKGDLAKVKALLKENPALVSNKDKNGWTPLHCAVINGHKDVVELLLLTSKAEVNAKNNKDETPLEDMVTRATMALSVGDGFSGTASWVPQPSDDPQLAIATLLIANGANINAETNRTEKAPLLGACRAKNWRFATLLIQKGARLDVAVPDGPDKGMTPLHYAVGYGSTEVVKLLITNKAPINAVAEKFSTPLHIAVLLGYQDIAKLLRQEGGHE